MHPARFSGCSVPGEALQNSRGLSAGAVSTSPSPQADLPMAAHLPWHSWQPSPTSPSAATSTCVPILPQFLMLGHLPQMQERWIKPNNWLEMKKKKKHRWKSSLGLTPWEVYFLFSTLPAVRTIFGWQKGFLSEPNTLGWERLHISQGLIIFQVTQAPGHTLGGRGCFWAASYWEQALPLALGLAASLMVAAIQHLPRVPLPLSQPPKKTTPTWKNI